MSDSVDRDDILEAEIKTWPEQPGVLLVWRHATIKGKQHEVLCSIAEGDYSISWYRIHGTGDQRGYTQHNESSDVSIDHAVAKMNLRFEEEEARRNPQGIDAMPAGPEMDRQIAIALRDKQSGRQVFLEVVELRDVSHLNDLFVTDFNHSRLNDYRFHVSHELGILPVLVRRPGDLGLEVWMPSTDRTQAYELIEELGADIHGTVHLTYDGDCFEPPPWDCYATWWAFEKAHGFAYTAELAICRCFLQKNMRHRQQALEELTQLDQDLGLYDL